MEEINAIAIEKSIFNFRKIFTTFSKKALFFTSLPFYWIIFFNYILNWFDLKFFIFVVMASAIMSFAGQSWGALDFFAR